MENHLQNKDKYQQARVSLLSQASESSQACSRVHKALAFLDTKPSPQQALVHVAALDRQIERVNSCLARGQLDWGQAGKFSILMAKQRDAVLAYVDSLPKPILVSIGGTVIELTRLDELQCCCHTDPECHLAKHVVKIV